jgi:excisionase family DNA binding protein
MRIARIARAPDQYRRITLERYLHRRWYFRQDTPSLNGNDSTPVLLTVAEASKRLRISHWSLYQLINSRRLETVKIGKRRLVPVAAIDTLIERLRSEGTL